MKEGFYWACLLWITLIGTYALSFDPKKRAQLSSHMSILLPESFMHKGCHISFHGWNCVIFHHYVKHVEKFLKWRNFWSVVSSLAHCFGNGPTMGLYSTHNTLLTMKQLWRLCPTYTPTYIQEVLTKSWQMIFFVRLGK